MITLCKQPTDEVLFRGFGTCFQLLGSKKVLICFKTVWGPSGDVLGPSGGRCWVSGLAAVHGPWVSGFAPPRTLGFGFRPAADLGFRVSGFGGAGGETPLGADYVSTPATRGGARRPQPRRRQWRRDVPRQRRPCRERRASGHFGDQNSFGRVSCFTFRWVAVFRVSLFDQQRCFVFHFSPHACVSGARAPMTSEARLRVQTPLTS